MYFLLPVLQCAYNFIGLPSIHSAFPQPLISVLLLNPPIEFLITVIIFHFVWMIVELFKGSHRWFWGGFGFVFWQAGKVGRSPWSAVDLSCCKAGFQSLWRAGEFAVLFWYCKVVLWDSTWNSMVLIRAPVLASPAPWQLWMMAPHPTPSHHPSPACSLSASDCWRGRGSESVGIPWKPDPTVPGCLLTLQHLLINFLVCFIHHF